VERRSLRWTSSICNVDYVVLYRELVLLVNYVLLMYCKQTAFVVVAVTDSWNMQTS